MRRRLRMNELRLTNYSEMYSDWSKWSKCNDACQQRRIRSCTAPETCKGSILKEQRDCVKTKGACHPKRRSRWGITKRLEDLMYDLLYDDWSPWSACTRSCKKRRYRTCSLKRWCRNTILLEEKKCYVSGGSCKKKEKDDDGNQEEGEEEEITKG